MAAREASATGVQWTFNPMGDVAREPRGDRILKSARVDRFLGARITAV